MTAAATHASAIPGVTRGGGSAVAWSLQPVQMLLLEEVLGNVQLLPGTRGCYLMSGSSQGEFVPHLQAGPPARSDQAG